MSGAGGEYPALRARAKAHGAAIFFLDEAGFSSEPNLGRTYGQKGETPVKLKLSAGKYKVTLVGPDGEKRTMNKSVSPGKTTTMVHRW